jgi:hypothetical protein
MPPGTDLITLGGTAGLIGYLLYSVYQFASGNWRPGKDVEAADTRTVAAVASGDKAVAAVQALTEENARWRALVERLLAEKGIKP